MKIGTLYLNVKVESFNLSKEKITKNNKNKAKIFFDRIEIENFFDRIEKLKVV